MAAQKATVLRDRHGSDKSYGTTDGLFRSRRRKRSMMARHAHRVLRATGTSYLGSCHTPPQLSHRPLNRAECTPEIFQT